MAEQTLNVADALNLALEHHQAGRLTEADHIYTQILAANPNSANALYLKGSLAFQSNRPKIAVDLLTRAVSLSPDQPAPRVNLASALRVLGRLADAERTCRDAIALDPTLAAAYDTLGMVLSEVRFFSQAGEAHRQAISLEPNNPDYYNNHGFVLLQQNQLEEAEQELTRALELRPDHVDAIINLGVAHYWQGRIIEAIQLFGRAIEIDPRNGRAYRQLLWLSRYDKEDGYADQMESVVADPSLRRPERIEFLFALGKAYADVGDFDLSFERFAEGNRLKHEVLNYDVSVHENAMSRIAKNYSPEFFADNPAISSATSDTPVFIVGMPRSGTTMVEQILSSHSQMSGAGELSIMPELVMEHSRKQHADFPECVIGLDDYQISELGQKYVNAVQGLYPNERYVIDKQTGNFLYAGLIIQALPNAKIIHCTRNPMDTCVSCFTLLFEQGQPFSFDLEILGRFYRSYQKLMTHFSKIAPDRILTVNYEEVVENQERETRRMLEFLDLPWEDACLSFHENDRAVQTASAGQVREPIYKKSVARWKRYEKHLGPLRDALGPLVEDL